jgi:hypothetical protein
MFYPKGLSNGTLSHVTYTIQAPNRKTNGRVVNPSYIQPVAQKGKKV